ncbi:MAG: DUF354 domain-containing protein [Terriglobales bacterium]
MSTASVTNPRERKLEVVSSPKSTKKRKIWVDLDNSPHVPFFRPIIEALRKRDYEVFVTARDAYQVRELTEFYGVAAIMVGKHHGKHILPKVIGTVWRAFRLTALVRKHKPDLAVCHGSRGMLLTSAFLGIPCLGLLDYEFTAIMPMIKPTWFLVPSVIPEASKVLRSKIVKYPGIKEDVYLSSFHPDQTLRERLSIPAGDLLITVRPPATEAHYHNPEAERLLAAALHRFVQESNTTILLLPRNKRQESELRSAWSGAITSQKIIIPAHAEDGLNLIWHSDLVISGGGTMNREAAAMGVPVYSIFRGKIGAVDHYLAEQGRLVLLETVEDVKTRINAVHREKVRQRFDGATNPTLEAIVREIVSIAETKTISSQAGRN